MSSSEKPKKVLIVDDEPSVVSYLEMLLRDSGYETASAGDGKEALEKIRQQKPDLVTLDISMPEASGTRFYKEIRTDPDLASVPIVIVTAVTGYAGDPYAFEKFISHRRLVPPPDGFFPKPIDRSEFLAKVDQLLA
jgi:CheY-like chemotaxis protein